MPWGYFAGVRDRTQKECRMSREAQSELVRMYSAARKSVAALIAARNAASTELEQWLIDQEIDIAKKILRDRTRDLEAQRKAK